MGRVNITSRLGPKNLYSQSDSAMVDKNVGPVEPNWLGRVGFTLIQVHSIFVIVYPQYYPFGPKSISLCLSNPNGSGSWTRIVEKTQQRRNIYGLGSPRHSSTHSRIRTLCHIPQIPTVRYHPFVSDLKSVIFIDGDGRYGP